MKRVWLSVVMLAPLLAGCAGSAARGDDFVPSSPKGLGSAQAWQPDFLLGLGDPSTSGLDAWTPQFDSAAKAYDLDGDGVDELISQGSDSKVYVFRALTGRVLAVLPTTSPTAWHVERVLNAVEAGVLRPGEPPSLVVTNHAAYVAAWRFNPVTSTDDHFVFQRQFDVRMDACNRSPGMDAKAALGDLDGDGKLEILVQTEEMGFYALRADGSTLWQKCWGGGNSAPVIADLDGDGRPEAIVASDAGFLAVLAGATGDPLWTYDALTAGISPASITVSPTVADLDGVPPLEILFTARHAPSADPATFADDHFAIFAVHQDPVTYQAALLWMRQPSWANPLSATQLVVHDVDGDGLQDILGMDWNTIGHSPGDWERLGPAHVFRLTASGEDVWVREMDTWWSNQDIALVDLEGDGSLSILVNGPAGSYDGLWRLSAATGASQGFLPLSGWKVTRGPQLLDLRNDGTMHLVAPVQPIDGGGRGALVVFDLETPYAAPWPGSG
ncbi:MAG: VCBS repeat-containing protein [Candidatus Thermoplasmatota archaeon]